MRLRASRPATICSAWRSRACAARKLYAGSWSEWIRDPHRPVARGESRRNCRRTVIYMQPQFVIVRALMNTPAKVLAPPNHAWKIDESLDLYQVEAWGKGYFSINARRPRRHPAEPGREPRNRSATMWSRD